MRVLVCLLLWGAGCVGSVEGLVDAAPPDGPDEVDPDPDIPPGTCLSCHGGGESSAPPKNLAGQTERTEPGVGAHREHLRVSDWRAIINCVDCHTVPSEVSSPGHIDGDNQAELTFSALNPMGTFDNATNTCSNMYCHGNGRANNGTVVFTSLTPMTCTSCHSMSAGGGGLQGEHGEHIGRDGMDCVTCHANTVDGNRMVIDRALHVNGTRDIAIPSGGTFDPGQRKCTNLACHGDEDW